MSWTKNKKSSLHGPHGPDCLYMKKVFVSERFCKRLKCSYLSGDGCTFGGLDAPDCRLTHIEYRDICLLQAKGVR